jgi:hypothetical protein
MSASLSSACNAFFFGLFFTGLLLPFRGTFVVLVILLLGLLPSCGSASTVTLILHGLASPAAPVSMINDLLGDPALFERDASGRVFRRGRAFVLSLLSA